MINCLKTLGIPSRHFIIQYYFLYPRHHSSDPESSIESSTPKKLGKMQFVPDNSPVPSPVKAVRTHADTMDPDYQPGDQSLEEAQEDDQAETQ